MHKENILTFNRGYSAVSFNLSWFKTFQMEGVLKNYIKGKSFCIKDKGQVLAFFFLKIHSIELGFESLSLHPLLH